MDSSSDTSEKKDSEKDEDEEIRIDSDEEEPFGLDKSPVLSPELDDYPPVDDDYEPPVYALPPSKAQLDEDSQVEVSSSPAFKSLDELFAQGKLTGTEVAILKAKYTDLFETLKTSREHEFELIQEAKRHTAQLDKQKVELSKDEEFPENVSTEAQKLRETLLKYNNELMLTDERNYDFDYKIECLIEEKGIMEREYNRLPKADEIEKRKKQLEADNEALEQEILQLQREKKKIGEVKRETDQTVNELSNQFYSIKEAIDGLKAESVAVTSVPTQLNKENEKIRKQRTDLEKSVSEKNSTLAELNSELLKLEKIANNMDIELEKLKTELANQEVINAGKTGTKDKIHKDMDVAREKEKTMIEDRATLDINLRHLNLERRNLMDTHNRRLREKDRELKNLKKTQLQLKAAEDALALTQQMHEKTKVNYDLFPRDDGSMEKRKKMIETEVDVFKRNLDQESSLSAAEQVRVTQSIEDEERLQFKLSDLRIEVIELTRLAAIKADEREQKARDFMRSEVRHKRVIEDLKAKQLQIQDHHKKNKELDLKLKDFAKLYDVIKSERNKCANQVQVTAQKAAEMREKIRILENEIEILRTNIHTREKQLQKLRLRHANSIVMRDQLRNEVSKQVQIDEELTESREQLRLEINQFNMLVNSSEEQMVRLRKQSDKAIQLRNDRAVQLIERNEEVYVLMEKIQTQEAVIQKGEIEMNSREEDIAFLRRQLKEEERSLKLMKQKLPKKRQLEDELTVLQIQLSVCQDRLLEMEGHSENPSMQGRLRLLDGSDPGPVELQEKTEDLEIRLALKEEQVLEKQLLLEAVMRLADRVEKKAMSGKNDTLVLAKQVNGYKSKMNTLTKRMKASTAELTMLMSQSLRLQQDVRDRQQLLESCYRRMEKGEPPSEDIEAEWLRSQAVEESRRQERLLEASAAAQQEQYQLSHGGVTTAEPRPNAYIPADEVDLPIPRPYGGNAPFKPVEPGSNMRHIRKPRPKPIEI